MLHLAATRTQIVHRHEVEPVLIAGAAVAQAPEQRDAGDEALLETTDRLQRRSAHCRVPGLDLDKSHQIAPPSDQVDIVMSQTEAMRFDVPAAGCEVSHGDPFPPDPAELTRVFPLGDRGKSPDACHGGEDTLGTPLQRYPSRATQDEIVGKGVKPYVSAEDSPSKR